MNKIVLVMLSFILFFGINAAFALNIGVVWSGKSGMTTRNISGFAAGMKELAPNVNIEYQKELDSIEDLAKVVGRFQKEKDGMVVLRSNGAEWLAKNKPSIPTFIGGCNHPGLLGAVASMEAPEGNITGVTYYLPVSTQFETFKAIVPNLTSVLLLVEKGHPSSKIDQDETMAICKKLGIKYSEKLCQTEADVIAAVNQARGKVSAIIIGNQAVVFDVTKKIVAAAGNTPVIAYSSKPITDGALGGFAADDNKLGYMLAESVVDVLVKGKKIADVAVKVDSEPGFYINTTSAEKLGLEIPYQILEAATLVK